MWTDNRHPGIVIILSPTNLRSTCSKAADCLQRQLQANTVKDVTGRLCPLKETDGVETSVFRWKRLHCSTSVCNTSLPLVACWCWLAHIVWAPACLSRQSTWLHPVWKGKMLLRLFREWVWIHFLHLNFTLSLVILVAQWEPFRQMDNHLERHSLPLVNHDLFYIVGHCSFDLFNILKKVCQHNTLRGLVVGLGRLDQLLITLTDCRFVAVKLEGKTDRRWFLLLAGLASGTFG